MVTMEQLDALYTKITDETSACFDEGATKLENRNQELHVMRNTIRNEMVANLEPGVAADDKHHEEQDGGG